MNTKSLQSSAEPVEARKPRILDLFCGEGGAAEGYRQAGFVVVGVDRKPQPRYVGHCFYEADALWFVSEFGYLFDAVHASPPCQRYSDLQRRTKRDYPDLIAPTRSALIATKRPYVIENVEGAPLYHPVTLCGTMFSGLRVLRHRLFETSFPVPQPEHPEHPLVFTHDKRKGHYGALNQSTAFVQVTGGGNCSVANARAAMQMPWATKGGLNEAVPPAYTKYVGEHLLRHLGKCRVDFPSRLDRQGNGIEWVEVPLLRSRSANRRGSFLLAAGESDGA